MYTIRKTLSVSAAHSLNLTYESKCEQVHGHNWKIATTVAGNELNEDGMLMDFSHIKKLVNSKFDHSNLNNFMEQPTAENICKYIFDSLSKHLEGSGIFCVKIEVEESEGSYASYEI